MKAGTYDFFTRTDQHGTLEVIAAALSEAESGPETVITVVDLEE